MNRVFGCRLAGGFRVVVSGASWLWQKPEIGGFVYIFVFVTKPSPREPQTLEIRNIQTLNLPLVSREWRNGSNSSYNCTPFLHALLTKGK